MLLVLWDVLSVILFLNSTVPFERYWLRSKWLSGCWFWTQRSLDIVCEIRKQHSRMVNRRMACPIRSQHAHSPYLEWNLSFGTMNSVNTGGRWGIPYRPHSSPTLLWTRHKKLADVGLTSATWSSVLSFKGDPVAWCEPELPSALLRTSPCLLRCQPFTHDARSTARAIVGLLLNHWVSLNACFCTCLPMHACLSDGVQSNISEVVGEGIYNSHVPLTVRGYQ